MLSSQMHAVDPTCRYLDLRALGSKDLPHTGDGVFPDSDESDQFASVDLA